ncbi:MAG TPA: C25 family cysteine peptidase, partial [Vicinamibacteria bacterium]|nr:C25 family cysteine peptidase [Vicinamibacteria bacterium]
FAIGDPRQQALLERVERRLARAGAAAAFVSSAARAQVVPLAAREATDRSRILPGRPRSIEPRRAPAPASAKIETVGEGVATVTRESLEAAGLPAGLRLADCRLTRQGLPVAFEVRDEGGVAEAAVFRAEALETAYSSRNVYVLTWAGRAPAMTVPLTIEADPARAGWVRVARPLLYVPSVPLGTDPWLWDQLVPGFGTWPYEWDPTAGTFDLAGWPDGAAAAVPVRLRFQGMTEHRHVVSVSLNGESLGTVELEGMASAYLEATATQLRSSANELRIDYATADGDPDGYAYLDYLELARPGGWQDPPVVATVRAFHDALPPPGVEYLIVTHPLFAAQAERLAEAKRREGMRVTVADVESAYDRLSGGVPEANAVRGLVRRAAGGGRLRYVLLLGDDSFDPDDRAGFGGWAFVPSLNGWDGIFGRVASENRYADLDGDGRPEVAIGRLPARTAAEADALVDKVERQLALLAPGASRHLFAVDNPGPDGFDFRAEARSVAARLPRRVVQKWADLAEGAAAARSNLFSGLAEGAVFTHYFGHGGPQTWADEGLLTVEDAASLPSAGTVVLAWSCQTQFFQYLFGPSVNESLLLKPDGGAVAAFGPFGITDAPMQTALAERLYDELLRGRVALGEAIRQAKARAVAEDPSSMPVVEGWNLLGDPSLLVSVGTVPTRRR